MLSRSVLCLLVAVVAGSTAAVVTPQDDPGWGIVGRMIQDCTSKEFLPCMQMKAVGVLDRAARAESIPLWDSVSLVRKEGARADSGRGLSEAELEAAARSPGGTSLSSLLWDRMARLISSHTLKVELPKMTPEQLQQGVEEGRGKMKKMMSMMMMAGMMKLAGMVPLKMGALFILAGKALIVSKIALVLSLIMVLKKLLSSKMDDGHGGGYSSGGGHGGGWDRRSFQGIPISPTGPIEVPVGTAQDLAYRGQRS